MPIAQLLEDWGLLEILDEMEEESKVNVKQLKILPYSEKKDWELIPKYHIGKK